MLYLNAFFEVEGVQEYILAVIAIIFVSEIIYILIDRIIE